MVNPIIHSFDPPLGSIKCQYTPSEKEAVIETYYQFNGVISIEMLKAAREKTWLGLGECKLIIDTYLKWLNTFGI